jgi:hypothetical protein
MGLGIGFFRIPNPGVKKGTGSRIQDPEHCQKTVSKLSEI